MNPPYLVATPKTRLHHFPSPHFDIMHKAIMPPPLLHPSYSRLITPWRVCVPQARERAVPSTPALKIV